MRSLREHWTRSQAFLLTRLVTLGRSLPTTGLLKARKDAESGQAESEWSWRVLSSVQTLSATPPGLTEQHL